MKCNKKRVLLSSIYFIVITAILLPSCTKESIQDKLLGYWVSVEGKPDVWIFREANTYKVAVSKRSGISRTLKPEVFLLKEENGNLFIDTGFRIGIAYNEATDILTISAHGDYYRAGKKQQSISKIQRK